MTKVLKISGDKLSLSDFYAVVLERQPVHFSEVAEKKMNRSRRLVGKILSEGEAVYGVNTGFGKLARERISNSEIQQLQVNLIRSHACGAGPPLSEAAVRGMLLLRAQVLAMGHSGVRPLIVARLVEILNCNLYPFIPSRGSVGACGDLIPLAHLALLLLGEGEAFFEGERLPGAQALKRAGIQPVTLEAKEGLSLVNGTQAALSLGLLALHRAERLAETATLAGAMSLSGSLNGYADGF